MIFTETQRPKSTNIKRSIEPMKTAGQILSTIRVALLIFAISALSAPSLRASTASKAAKELIETISKKFGTSLTEEASEAMARRADELIAKYGDDAIDALRRFGPEALDVVDAAGDAGAVYVKLMMRHGSEAMWVVANPERRALFTHYGDDAAEAMIRHGEIAEPLVERFGGNAAGALANLSTRNGRRLVMSANDGALDAVPQQSFKLLAVLRRYGDKAAEFIWQNKGALTVAATLTTFVSDPEPFINGTRQLSESVVDHVVAPIASAAANQFPWRWLWLSLSVLGTVGLIAFGTLCLAPQFTRTRRKPR